MLQYLKHKWWKENVQNKQNCEVRWQTVRTVFYFIWFEPLPLSRWAFAVEPLRLCAFAPFPLSLCCWVFAFEPLPLSLVVPNKQNCEVRRQTVVTVSYFVSTSAGWGSARGLFPFPELEDPGWVVLEPAGRAGTGCCGGDGGVGAGEEERQAARRWNNIQCILMFNGNHRYDWNTLKSDYFSCCHTGMSHFKCLFLFLGYAEQFVFMSELNLSHSKWLSNWQWFYFWPVHPVLRVD